MRKRTYQFIIYQVVKLSEDSQAIIHLKTVLQKLWNEPGTKELVNEILFDNVTFLMNDEETNKYVNGKLEEVSLKLLQAVITEALKSTVSRALLSDTLKEHGKQYLISVTNSNKVRNNIGDMMRAGTWSAVTPRFLCGGKKKKK